MFIAGQRLSEFSIYVGSDGVCASYAAEQLRRYVKSAFGYSLDIVSNKRDGKQIVLCVDGGKDEDGFCGFYEGGNFYLKGKSERALLYAVYDFLERFIGWRFFAAEMQFKGVETGAYMRRCEKLMQPRYSEITETTRYEETPGILFRDFYGHATVDEDWCAKNKINGDIWRLKNTPDYMGGAERFADDGGHTFFKLLPYDKYFEAHPEYFSLVNGKRIGGSEGQICLSCEGALQEIIKNVKEILRKNPNAKYVSVSQNDNNNWCECDECLKKEKEIGLGGLLFGFVNRVAEALEEEFPNVKVHTFAYDMTAQNCNVTLHKNVVLQYCLRSCRGHDLSDPSCKLNVVISNSLKKLSASCQELFIYDYISSEAHLLQFMPDIFRLKEKMKFFADCKVRGIYSEMDIFNQNSPCMEELRAYVYAKLMWNPHMSDEEYNSHIDEFLQGYYGKGWKHLRRFLEIWAEETDDAHYDSVLGNVGDKDGHDIIGDDGIPVRCAFMPKEKVNEVCKLLEDEICKAEVLAGSEERDRVHMLRAGTLWYRLFHTMKDIMQNGTEEEKAKAVADNRELCSIMRRYCMKYTWSIGMSETTAMYKDFTLMPEDWNYWEKNSKRCVFNEHVR